MSSCPIEVGKFKEAEAIPDNASNDSEQSGKAMRPLALESDEPKQHVEQHGRPKLPAYGMLGVAEEVADFEGLFDLLEEGFDSPSASIQVADAGSGPVEVIGQEDHDDPFAIDFNRGFDAAQSLRILRAGLLGDQSDLIIADDIAFGLVQALAADTVPQVVFGAGDPEDAPPGEIEEVGEVDVGLVEHGDLSGLKPGAELHGASVVMVGGLLDDGEGRKESLQVQTKMHLRSRLTAAVLGPVHAVGHQCDGRRVDRMDRTLEAAGQTTVTTGWTKSRVQRLEMSQDAPKQFLHHVAIAMLVGVRERIATWCDCTPDCSKFGSVVSKAVADIVQPNRVGQLRKQKTDHMAPRSEGAGLLVHAMLARKFFRQVRRDEFTKLMQCAAVMLGRRYLFHASDSLVGIRRRPPFLSELEPSSQLHPMG